MELHWIIFRYLLYVQQCHINKQRSQQVMMGKQKFAAH